MRKGVIDVTLAAFSASFSCLLTLALSIPISSAAESVVVLSKSSIGITGADIIYVGTFLGIVVYFYYIIRRVMSVSFDRMQGDGRGANPPQSEATSKT